MKPVLSALALATACLGASLHAQAPASLAQDPAAPTHSVVLASEPRFAPALPDATAAWPPLAQAARRASGAPAALEWESAASTSRRNRILRGTAYGALSGLVLGAAVGLALDNGTGCGASRCEPRTQGSIIWGTAAGAVLGGAISAWRSRGDDPSPAR